MARDGIPTEKLAAIQSLPSSTSNKAGAKLIGVDEKTVAKYRARAGGPASPLGGSATATPPTPPASPPRLAAALGAAGEGAATAPAVPGTLDPHVLPPGVSAEAVASEMVQLVDSLIVIIVTLAASRTGRYVDARTQEELPLTPMEKEAMRSAALRGAPVLYKFCGGAALSAGIFGVLVVGAIHSRLQRCPRQIDGGTPPSQPGSVQPKAPSTVPSHVKPSNGASPGVNASAHTEAELRAISTAAMRRAGLV